MLWNTGVPHTLSGRSAEIIDEAKSVEGLTGIKIRLREVEGRRRESLAGDVASTSAVEGGVTVVTVEASVVGVATLDSPATDTPLPAKSTKSLKRSSSTANSSSVRQATSTIAPRKRSKPERWIGAAAALEEKALARQKEDGVNGNSGKGRSGSSGGRDREREAKAREELVTGSVRYRF